MTVTDSRLQVRLSGGEWGWLEDRAARMAGPSAPVQARAELGLWRAALAAELARIRLSLGQARCLADVLGGSQMQGAVATGAGIAHAECYDAFRLARRSPGREAGSYGAKHGIDEAALLDYLGGLGPAADHALRDAISRWWAAAGPQDTAEGFAAAGLRVTP